MRLFVAIQLPEAIRLDLASLAASRQTDLPSGRWVAPENLHLTVAFLGERNPDDLPGLTVAIELVGRRHPPLSLVTAGPGTFPARRPARAAFVGLEPSAGLDALQSDLRQAVDKALQRQPDGRPFHPHLTLARSRRPWPRWAVDRWCAPPFPCAGREFQVTYIDLMQSRLTPSGPIYQRLRRFPLEG